MLSTINHLKSLEEKATGSGCRGGEIRFPDRNRRSFRGQCLFPDVVVIPKLRDGQGYIRQKQLRNLVDSDRYVL